MSSPSSTHRAPMGDRLLLVCPCGRILSPSREVRVCTQGLSHVRLFVIPWMQAHYAPLSMGIFQTRILEWVVISSSRGSSRPRDQNCVSCQSYHCTIWEAIMGGGKALSTGTCRQIHPLRFWFFKTVVGPRLWYFFFKLNFQAGFK